MEQNSPETFETTINRWYIDTRPYVPQPHNTKALHTLPLLSTLQHADQEAVTRFIRPADRFMSLASALLKYTFIHRRAKIPWSDIQISRTPAPHRRPYWQPPEDWSTADIYDESDIDDESCQIRGLEYNVSHQAGLVTIIGCSTPTAQVPSPINSSLNSTTPTIIDSMTRIDLKSHPTCTAFDDRDIIRLGVDIACTNEDKRTPKDLNSQSKFDEWVEIFAEMFSDRERRLMREAPIYVPVQEREEGQWSDSNSSSPTSSLRNSNSAVNVVREQDSNTINMKMRRFYAYWGLKEAYIKMVGEGLLASWLRELEFLDVHAPPPPPPAKPQQRNGQSSVVSNNHSRNGSATQTILGSQKSQHNNIPSSTSPHLPAVGESSAIADETDGQHAKPGSTATIPPINTNSSMAHRRTSSIRPRICTHNAGPQCP